ncbi:hypothetical protein P170DRAFT_405762 [Aspergillus steynii IBT 23096]|uniref:Uncharacterized protein n=1 Tax=Aspergillus steynii IBT 23096 TaxID=1392250 RepID=A0A2I2GCG9_9EURO|nr:uncharacterized protein P170DRAFT_405762 [Aspergillus steynii IBT 23096]PLB50547.1 hypothetical protein P170DRAFT_405762 [Aspergillus steynii IBT 23096]
MSMSRSETDIILNKANVALARSQRLVASWLPPQTSEELANLKSEEELQREEDEIFTAVPETLGIGAPLPTKAADGSWNRTELDSNDKLRKQLLGKNYKRVVAASAGASATVTPGKPGTRANPGPSAKELDDEDGHDEDEGRTTSVGTSQRRLKKRKAALEGSHNHHEVATSAGEGQENITSPQEGASPRQPPRSKSNKKATSFLDEILADRSKRRKKK